MMQFFKHTYIKYLLLILLSIKAISYIIENTALCLDQDITCQVDFNDIESDTDEEKEIEETQKVVEKTSIIQLSKVLRTTKRHFNTHKNYRTQHLEFTTPPPELV